MPSPFPGMDPYLEGYLWPDVHQALASKIRQMLTPLLRPRYTARLAIYVVEDTAPEGDIGIMYPDIEVILPRNRNTGPGTQPVGAVMVSETSQFGFTPATLTIPVMLPIEVQITNVEIHDTASNQLVTCIELLSPVNKREPGLATYRQKRQRLYQAGVHILEIDLLRRGTRPLIHPRIGEAAYIVALTRAHSGETNLWPLTLQSSLPTIPVPLRAPDNDVSLPLSTALNAIYEEAAYELSIDYTQDPPVPPLAAAETTANLLLKINQSFDSITWAHYHVLMGKRQAETLNPEEQQELIRLTDQIETANVQRIELVAELAQLRNKDVDTIIQELGLQPVIHD